MKSIVAIAGVAVAISAGIYIAGNAMAPRPAPLEQSQTETTTAPMDVQRNAELNRMLEGCLQNAGSDNQIIISACQTKLSPDSINQICTLEDPRYDICQPEGLQKVERYRTLRGL